MITNEEVCCLLQKDWQDVMKRVLSLKEELPKDERSNVKVFMKRLANEYFDMELLSKSIQDKSKAEQAIQIAKDIRGKARECDDAISANNYKKLEELNPMVTKAFQDFFETLNDVPDEL